MRRRTASVVVTVAGVLAGVVGALLMDRLRERAEAARRVEAARRSRAAAVRRVEELLSLAERAEAATKAMNGFTLEVWGRRWPM